MLYSVRVFFVNVADTPTYVLVISEWL